MASRETLSIALTPEQSAWVKAQAERDGCVDASEFVGRLIRQEQRRKAKAELEASLLEAMNGPSRELTPEAWDEIIAEGNRRAAEIRRRRA
jgi:Arc/MetJ-type ribon-helix-helix transcriptional regulator